MNIKACRGRERGVGTGTCRGHIFKASVDRGAIILTMTSSLTGRGVGAGRGARGAICALNHATNKIYGAEIKTRSFSLLRSFPPPRSGRLTPARKIHRDFSKCSGDGVCGVETILFYAYCRLRCFVC